MISSLYVSPIGGEHPLRLVARDDDAPERRVRFDDASHRLLDGAKILFGEPAARLVEVVVETVVDRRADGHLRAGKETLDRVGHDMRRRVPNDRETLGGRRANGGQLGRRCRDGGMQVDDAAVKAHGDDVLLERTCGCKKLAGGLSVGHRRGGYSPERREALLAARRRPVTKWG